MATTSNTTTGGTSTRRKPRKTTKSTVRRTTRGTTTTTTQPRTTAGQVQLYAERAVLVPVGASLVARDNLVATVTGMVSKYRTRNGFERELKRYERRGATARNRVERQMRRTRTRFERQVRQRRSLVERTIRQNRRRVEREVRSVRKDLGRQSGMGSDRVEKLVSDAQGLISAPVSVTSLLRILAENPVRPWQYQSWIYPGAPDFEARAAVILDLYQGYYQGQRLRPGDQILSFDAKPQIQARGRHHATVPAAPGKPVRVEHEYTRHGAERWGREPRWGVEKHCGSARLILPDGSLLPHEQSPIVDVLRTGVPARNVEVFIERPDGSRIPVLVNFTALKSANGEITGAVTSFMSGPPALCRKPFRTARVIGVVSSSFTFPL